MFFDKSCKKIGISRPNPLLIPQLLSKDLFATLYPGFTYENLAFCSSDFFEDPYKKYRKKFQKPIDISIKVCYTSCCAWRDGWVGLRRTTGNRVCTDTASRVRIPISPPTKKPNLSTRQIRLFWMKRTCGAWKMKQGIALWSAHAHEDVWCASLHVPFAERFMRA